MADAINRDHAHPRFLPGIPLDPALRATTEMAEAAAGADAVLIAVPSQAVRGVAHALAPHAAPDLAIVICAKGIEAATDATMADVVAEELPGRPIAVLSGPSFAKGCGRRAADGRRARRRRCGPTPIAGPDRRLGRRKLALALGSPSFRPYLTDDIAGVEIGGTVKNVVAIACGVARGLWFRRQYPGGADHPRAGRDHPARHGAGRPAGDADRSRRPSAT